MTTQVEIAKLEIKHEVSAAAKGAGMLSVGALAGVVAVFMLSAAAAWAIAAPLNEWLGFLIVGVVWVLVAVVFALLGKRRLSDIKSLPERTLDELRPTATSPEVDLSRQRPTTAVSRL